MNARNTWKDKAAYDRKARELAVMFEKNFAENASDAAAEIKEAGPKTTTAESAAPSNLHARASSNVPDRLDELESGPPECAHASEGSAMTDIARLFQAFLAPALFVSATALLILSINVRLMGIVSRLRQYVHAKHDAAKNNRVQEAEAYTAQISLIEQRAEMIRRCFLLVLISLAGTIASCLLLGFGLYWKEAAVAAVVVFVLAMICLLAGTFYYIREVIVALSSVRNEARDSALHGPRPTARDSPPPHVLTDCLADGMEREFGQVTGLAPNLRPGPHLQRRSVQSAAPPARTPGSAPASQSSPECNSALPNAPSGRTATPSSCKRLATAAASSPKSQNTKFAEVGTTRYPSPDNPSAQNTRLHGIVLHHAVNVGHGRRLPPSPPPAPPTTPKTYSACARNSPAIPPGPCHIPRAGPPVRAPSKMSAARPRSRPAEHTPATSNINFPQRREMQRKLVVSLVQHHHHMPGNLAPENSPPRPLRASFR